MSERKVLPPVYFLCAIVLMITLHFLLPVAEIIASPWTLSGLVPLGLGIGLTLVAARAFTRHGTTIKPFQESSALVTEGAFQLSRNPMYLGMVLILFGIGILMGLALPFAVIPVFIILLERDFIRVEERMLEAKFGQRFHEYKTKVRRWL
jgi:protein-S-isoprenylcysteine O-methyltransferase Ste14